MRAAVAIALLFATAAAAQLRSIPADAERAEMRHVQEHIVAINGRPAELAPGAQIRDVANRLIVPMALPAGALVKHRLQPGRPGSDWQVLPPHRTPYSSLAH